MRPDIFNLEMIQESEESVSSFKSRVQDMGKYDVPEAARVIASHGFPHKVKFIWRKDEKKFTDDELTLINWELLPAALTDHFPIKYLSKHPYWSKYERD